MNITQRIIAILGIIGVAAIEHHEIAQAKSIQSYKYTRISLYTIIPYTLMRSFQEKW